MADDGARGRLFRDFELALIASTGDNCCHLFGLRCFGCMQPNNMESAYPDPLQ